MTVCAAGIAEKGRAIVMVADRLRTFGDGEMQLVIEESKAVELSNGLVILYAGMDSVCQKVIGRAAWLFTEPESVTGPRTHPIEIMRVIYQGYDGVRTDSIEQEILNPRGLNRVTYNERPNTMLDLPTAFRAEIDGKVRDYRFDCELLVCGFAPTTGNPMIFTIDGDGHHRAGDFGAIGSGGDAAQSELVWRETNANDELARVLYEVYAAKKRSEMNAYVGTEVEDTDVWVMIRAGKDEGKSTRALLRMTNADVKRLLERPFKWNDRTPFTKRRKGELVPQEPVKNWELGLRTLCRDILANATKAAAKRSK